MKVVIIANFTSFISLLAQRDKLTRAIARNSEANKSRPYYVPLRQVDRTRISDAFATGYKRTNSKKLSSSMVHLTRNETKGRIRISQHPWKYNGVNNNRRERQRPFVERMFSTWWTRKGDKVPFEYVWSRTPEGHWEAGHRKIRGFLF